VIISRTPLRVSLVGGGSDLPAWYERHGGAVVSMAIQQFVTIIVKRLAPFHDHRFRVSYSKTELASSVAEIAHPLVREALSLLDIDEPLEIVSISDVPAGTGLGSSSAFTVGLLHALHALRGEQPSWRQLADEACEIEIERLSEPIGKQDQYIAAAGGLEHIVFRPDGGVDVQPVRCSATRLAALEARLVAVHTGGARRAGDILREIEPSNTGTTRALRELAALCEPMRAILEADGGGEPSAGLEGVGELLDLAWSSKRTLAGSVSSPRIDELYRTARQAGATGGKLLGAGGSGFLLLYVEPQVRAAVLQALNRHLTLPVRVAHQGSRIVYSELPG